MGAVMRPIQAAWRQRVRSGKAETSVGGGAVLPRDPVMLLSFVNMKLRDFYENLDALCEDLGADRQNLADKLSEIGYRYDTDRNQFV